MGGSVGRTTGTDERGSIEAGRAGTSTGFGSEGSVGVVTTGEPPAAGGGNTGIGGGSAAGFDTGAGSSGTGIGSARATASSAPPAVTATPTAAPIRRALLAIARPPVAGTPALRQFSSY